MDAYIKPTCGEQTGYGCGLILYVSEGNNGRAGRKGSV